LNRWRADAVAAYPVSVNLKPTSAELQLKLGGGALRQGFVPRAVLPAHRGRPGGPFEEPLHAEADLDDACKAFDLALHFTRPPQSGEAGDGRGMDAGDLSPDADPRQVRALPRCTTRLYGAGLAHARRRRFLRAAALFRRCRALKPSKGSSALALGGALLGECQARVAFDGDVQAAAAALAKQPGSRHPRVLAPPLPARAVGRIAAAATTSTTAASTARRGRRAQARCLRSCLSLRRRSTPL
jgi:hypothetical protein